MRIERQIDIEDELRKALSPYMVAYCRPLPAKPTLPCVLVQQVGGSARDHLNSFDVMIDARAEDDATALDTARNAVGLIKAIAGQGTAPFSYAEVNTIGSWGSDPVRPDLALCTARLTVYTHPETHDMEEI